MGDNRKRARDDADLRTIAGYGARLTHVALARERVALWAVDDLERYVDRAALLGGIDPPEPPYWAHCWSGARVLADALPACAGRVIDVGCGLGLPGLVAARRGGRVLFVDRAPAPLAFVRASLAANGATALGVVAADLTRPAWRASFDLVLAAEVLYDREAFPALASALAHLLAPGGAIVLADGHRIDTRAFYEAARACGFVWTARDYAVREEGLPVTVTLATLRRP